MQVSTYILFFVFIFSNSKLKIENKIQQILATKECANELEKYKRNMNDVNVFDEQTSFYV